MRYILSLHAYFRRYFKKQSYPCQVQGKALHKAPELESDHHYRLFLALISALIELRAFLEFTNCRPVW